MSRDRPGPKHTGDLADMIKSKLGTGARIGEVLALRWSEVDLGANGPH
jgi:integrase